MINAGNVKYYDRILSNIYNAANTQIDLKEAARISAVEEGLVKTIAKELEARDFIMNLKDSTCREGTSLIIKDKSTVKYFLDKGGFQGEHDEKYPPKLRELNNYFYKIVKEQRIMRIQYTEEEDNLISDLLTLELIRENGSFYVLSKEGLKLSMSRKTVQDYIEQQRMSSRR